MAKSRDRAKEFDLIVTCEMEADPSIEADAEAAEREALDNEPPLKPGRPRTTMTREVIIRILRSIRLGMAPDRAAAMNGVSTSTFASFLARNRTFASLVQRADAAAEDTFRGRVYKASRTQWQASAWMLERRWSERWARKDAPMYTESPQETARKIQSALTRIAQSVPEPPPPQP